MSTALIPHTIDDIPSAATPSGLVRADGSFAPRLRNVNSIRSPKAVKIPIPMEISKLIIYLDTDEFSLISISVHGGKSSPEICYDTYYSGELKNILITERPQP